MNDRRQRGERLSAILDEGMTMIAKPFKTREEVIAGIADLFNRAAWGPKENAGMTDKPLPETLIQIAAGVGSVQRVVTLTLATDVLKVVEAWARAEGETLDQQISGLVEARAREDIELMDAEDRAELGLSDWQAPPPKPIRRLPYDDDDLPF